MAITLSQRAWYPNGTRMEGGNLLVRQNAGNFGFFEDNLDCPKTLDEDDNEIDAMDSSEGCYGDGCSN